VNTLDVWTHIIVAADILYFIGCSYSKWKSKVQRSVTLSSAEAEFVACMEAAKEIKSVAQILNNMGIKVKTPIIVRVDNVGAIFMTENVSTNGRTKHIDVRHHYVQEFVEKVFFKIIFVRSEYNFADGFTKNVSGAIYDAHVTEFMADRSAVTSN
jgi:hypothetical protein